MYMCVLNLIYSFQELAFTPNGTLNPAFQPIQHSIYHQYIERWLKYFQRQQIHIVDGDQFLKNPLAELRKVETFLGLSHKISHSQLAYNATKGFFCIETVPGIMKCLNEGKGVEHPAVANHQIEQLRNYFKPYNENFYQQVGQRFDW